MTEQKIKIVDADAGDTFEQKIGRTTYIVGVHFSTTSKEMLVDKIEKLILNDLEKQKII